MLLAELVAFQAALARFFARERLEAHDLCNITAAFDVSFTGAVAGLASLILRAAMIDSGLPVRTVVVGLAYLLVTRLAGIGAHVQRRIGGIGYIVLLDSLVRRPCGRIRRIVTLTSCSRKRHQWKQQKNSPQPDTFAAHRTTL